jgi:hypothetical protein
VIRLTILIASAVISCAPISSAHAQSGQRDRVPTSQPPPPATVGAPETLPPAEASSTDVTQPAYQQPRAMTEHTTAQSYDRQISDLQQAVSQLQSEVERLRAEADTLRLPSDETYLTTRRPAAGVRCGTRGTISIASLLGRIHDHPGIVSLRDSESEGDVSTVMVFYANCQQER